MKTWFCSVLAFCIIINLLSCSKSGALSKALVLTSGAWTCTADDIDPGRIVLNQLETDMYQFLDPCEKDDYIVFNTDGTYALNNGPTKCTPTDPQKIEGTWYFSDSDTKLNLSPYNNYIFNVSDIIELNATTLKLVYYTKNASGDITRIHTVQFRH